MGRPDVDLALLVEAESGRNPSALERDLSLHNDVLFSLLSVCQLVIDIAGELSARKRLSYADHTEAYIRAVKRHSMLRAVKRFSSPPIHPLDVAVRVPRDADQGTVCDQADGSPVSKPSAKIALGSHS